MVADPVMKSAVATKGLLAVTVVITCWIVVVDARRHTPTVCTTPGQQNCISTKQARRMGLPVPKPTKECAYPGQIDCKYNATEFAMKISNSSKRVPGRFDLS